MPSLLGIVQAADNFPHGQATTPSHNANGEEFVPLHLTAEDAAASLLPIGLLRPNVYAALLEAPEDWAVVNGEGGPRALIFKADSETTRSALLARIAAQWKTEGRFADALDGWRNEKYAIYADPRSSGVSGDALGFTLERAACALFGVATRGVHLTAYEGDGEDMMIWVPRRSATKATWPGYLDNTVAGGIIAGMTPLETIIKECDEEASLPERLVVSRLKHVGAATYTYVTETGWLQPEIEYLYDLQLPARDSPEYVLPRPHDDEVESFELMSVPQVLSALHAGRFKPNCGLTLVDFFIRHGLVTPDNEPNYLQIQWHIRRPVGVGYP